MNFDNGYQAELIRRMTMKTFMSRVGHVLHEEMFDQTLSPVVGEILKRWNRGKTLLSDGQVKQLCQKLNVKLEHTSSGDESFDLDEIERFARFRSMRQALAEAHVEIERGRFEKAFQGIEKSYNHGLIGSEPPQDALHSEVKRLPRRDLVKTGLPSLDGPGGFKGGVGAGEIAVVMAITGGGKSSFLTYLASQALRQGKKVFYATLEVPREDIFRKFQSALTGKEDPSKKEWAAVQKKIKAPLILEGYEPFSMTVADLDRIIPADVGFVVVDYADYLNASGEGGIGNEYQSVGSVYTDMKRLALRRSLKGNCRVWTASQANRSAYSDGADNKDKKKSPLIYLHHFESCIRKGFIADQVITLNQTETERVPNAKTGNSTGILFSAKNRHGPAFMQLPITINWSKCGFVEGSFT